MVLKLQIQFFSYILFFKQEQFSLKIRSVSKISKKGESSKISHCQQKCNNSGGEFPVYGHRFFYLQMWLDESREPAVASRGDDAKSEDDRDCLLSEHCLEKEGQK